jgi:hypothetical protein
MWLIPAALMLVACGGTGAGEPLLLANGSGSIDGAPFTPAFGASNVLQSGTVNSVLATASVNCGSLTAMSDPSDGIYVQVQVPAAVVGVASKNMVMFDVVSGGQLHGSGSGDGTVEVTSVTDDVLDLKISYSKTLSGKAYALNGTFQVHRCR